MFSNLSSVMIKALLLIRPFKERQWMEQLTQRWLKLLACDNRHCLHDRYHKNFHGWLLTSRHFFLMIPIFNVYIWRWGYLLKYCGLCPEQKSEPKQTPKYIFFALVGMKTCHESGIARNLELKYFLLFCSHSAWLLSKSHLQGQQVEFTEICFKIPLYKT